MKLNEIARVVFTTGKELFFDPYQKNKQTGAFILIDPITNNTSAVGMIIDRVDAKERRELSSSDFGIPEERAFPMPDAALYRAAELGALG